ncbi:transcription termination/antitermination protein NusG [Candidatus Binatia bacterium]|jgi:transcriptional antiterminator NusG|nr:transcription termination/antitermination protein NusG [Candidatus Binatia bacterium]
MSETKPAGTVSPRWYVVHTYSGYEAKVKASLDERRRGELAKKKADLATLEAKADKSDKDAAAIADLTRAVEQLESFRQVLVPAEKVVELVKGQRRTSTRKFFPGYILVNIDILGDFIKGFIKSTPRVTGFVGGTDDPPAISESEVREITQQMEEGGVKPKVLFETGESVKVIDGPFQDFNGTVEEVKPDKGKLRVLISIFGRATPVELDFIQVEKA